MRTITLEFDMLTPTLNVWMRTHWAARRRVMELWSWTIRQQLSGQFWIDSDPIRACQLHVERRSTAVPDIDNAVGGMKPLLDCLVVPTKRNPWGNGVIRNDDQSCVMLLHVETPRVLVGETGMTVIIQEIARA